MNRLEQSKLNVGGGGGGGWTGSLNGLTIRAPNGAKNPYQKKLRWSKKVEGGLSFLTKSKKNSFFMPPLVCQSQNLK